MGFGNGPRIVTDGLVFAADAVDPNSYNPTENLLYYTSQIGTQMGVYYGSGSSTPLSMSLNADIAPDGTNTATILNQTGSNVTEYIYGLNGIYSTILDPNSIYTYSIYAKSGSKNNFSFTIDENSFGGYRYRFDYYFSNKVLSTFYLGAPNNGRILDSGSQEVGNGWVRIYGTFLTSTGSVSAIVDMIGRFGNGTGSVSVWGRQLEKKSKPTNYTEITTTPITGSKAWNNLTGNANSGTILGTPIYTASYNGGISFLSSSTYLNTNIVVPSPLTSSTTYEIAFTPATGSEISFAGLIGYSGYNSNGFSLGLMYPNIISQGYSGSTSFYESPTTFSYSTINVFTAVYESRKNTYYLNGKLITTSSYAFDVVSSPTAIRVGGYSQGGWNQSQCVLFYSRVYNRALSSTEVLQNYNAQKSRFGL